MGESTSIDHKFDVIVVGAGLGGLAASAELALNNKKVLLLEKHESPGGYASSFVRGRFEFESSLHQIDSVGTVDKPGHLGKFFKELGLIPERLKFFQAPEIYCSMFDDRKKYVLPFGLKEYEDKLVSYFPKEERQIHKFMKVLIQIGEGLNVGIKPLKLLFKYPWFVRVLGLKLDEFLKKFFTNRRLINVISQLWGYIGQNPLDINAIMFCAMMHSYLVNGGAFPNLTSHNLSLLIATRIRELGGTVKYNALVDRILMDGDRVIGVELLNKEHYYADAVINNLNPRCTLQKMIPPEKVPKSYLRRVLAPSIGPSIFCVYLGVNKPPEELGLTEYATFISKSENIGEICLKSGLQETGLIVATCYNKIFPNISPPGTSIITLITIQIGKDWHTVPPQEYHSVKDKVANDLVSIFEKYLCPDIRQHIEVCEIATPLTAYRYTKNLDGSIYGSDSSVYNSPAFNLPHKSPIKGLYFCGAWIDGGGYSPNLGGGRIAAKKVIKDLAKRRNGGK
ncbi:MAG: phytoene desaturase family protein [Promethearchaeota archaeon]